MKIKVFAPATVANVAVGFDILGFAIYRVGDIIELKKINKPEVRIVQITGVTNVPENSAENTATIGLIELIKDKKLNFGFEVSIKKGIPLGSGLGGSAASAVGGIFAASHFLKTKLTKEELLYYSLIGESFASGSAHADNVAPCLFGGMTCVSPKNDVNIVPYPKKLICVLVKPNISVNTKEARLLLKDTLSLRDHIQQSSNLAGFLLGCFNNDFKLIKSSLSDVIIEPQRSKLIPHFDKVKNAALSNNALGCSISGSGPTIFAFASNLIEADKIRQAMVKEFSNNGVCSQSWITPISKESVRKI
jgi:homoserine kinase